MRRLLGGNRCGDSSRRRNGGRGDRRCGITAVPGGTYLADSGDCYEPDGRPSPPVGATTMSATARTPSARTEVAPAGVAKASRNGSRAPRRAVPHYRAAIPPPIDDSDEFVALAISPNTGLVGCDTRQLAQDLRPGSSMLLAPAQQGLAGSVRSFRPGTT